MSAAASGIGERLRAHLPAAAFRPLAQRYLEEPRGRYTAPPGGLVVAPACTAEVAVLLAACNEAGIGVVPYGGGTGLVGGQIAAEGEPVILSMERMATLRAVLPEENVMTAEGGAILSDLHDAANAAGRLFPLSLASQGSARIGGLLATNAGGVNTLRYGNARDLCLGVEAVLADGTVVNALSRLRKDNTGYDLRHLLVGSEGTLGVITAASLRLFARPVAEAAALVAVTGPEAALQLLALAREEMGEGVSAFELMHRQSFDFLAETMPEMRQPFPEPPEWAVLVDIGLAAGQDPGAGLERLFENGLSEGLVSDGVVAQSEAQRADFWALREAIPEANRRIGAVSSHDISVPLGAIPEFLARAPGVVAEIGGFRVNAFGHVGDGNLHWNVFPPPGGAAADHEAAREPIKRAVHDLVHSLGGSVSAEHGIGRLKVADLERYGDPGRLAAMRRIKAALDPNGILNPGAVLRPGAGG